MNVVLGWLLLWSCVNLCVDLFLWVFVFVIGIDYFDNVVFLFFVSYIVGGINVLFDEFVWLLSVYVVMVVFGIL